MKKFALLLPFVFVAGVALADEQPAAAAMAAPEAPKAEKVAQAKTHDVQAEVVSADVEKKTLTIKGEKENQTVPVEGKAIAALKDLKPGSYTLTCKDDEKGAHKSVVDIKAPAVAKAPEKK